MPDRKHRQPVFVRSLIATAALAAAGTAHADILFVLAPGPTAGQTRISATGQATTTAVTGSLGGFYFDFFLPDDVAIELNGASFSATGSQSGEQTAQDLTLGSETDGRDLLALGFAMPFQAGETVTVSGSTLINLPIESFANVVGAPAQPFFAPSVLYVQSPKATRVIALEGDAAPDGVSLISDLEAPTLNDSGALAFGAGIIDAAPGSSEIEGIFLASGAPLATETAALQNQSAGVASGFFGQFRTFTLPSNNAGDVVIDATMIIMPGDDPNQGNPDNAVFTYRDGQLVQRFRSGDPAPDGNGTIDFAFGSVTATGLARDGNMLASVSYSSLPSRGNPRRSLVLSSPLEPVPTILGRPGQILPGSGQPYVSSSEASVNNMGEAVFLTNSDLSENIDTELYFYDQGSLEQLATVGSQFDGLNGAVASIRRLSELNDAGQFAAIISVAAETGRGQTMDALIVFDDSSAPPTVVAQAGDAVPNSTDTFSFFQTVDLNEAGDLIFFGIYGQQSGGLFRWADGVISPVFQRGDLSPDGSGIINMSQGTALNDNGETAQLLAMNPATPNDTVRNELLYGDTQMGLLPVAQEGQRLLGSSIFSIRFRDSNMTTFSGFNNRGQIAYQFQLFDGRSGIALWTPPGRDPDQDLDGVADLDDNCLLVSNVDQRDSDNDDIGNACDADIALPNNCVVNAGDLGALRLAFFATPGSANWNPDADLNGDDVVNIVDLGAMRTQFFMAPGPSGLTAACR